MTAQFGWHVTPRRSVRNILREGLLPRIGPRAQQLGESQPAVYLFTSLEACLEGVEQWAADAMPDEPLALLRVRIPRDADEARGAAFERCITSAIPTWMCEVVSFDLLGEVPDTLVARYAETAKRQLAR